MADDSNNGSRDKLRRPSLDETARLFDGRGKVSALVMLVDFLSILIWRDKAITSTNAGKMKKKQGPDA